MTRVLLLLSLLTVACADSSDEQVPQRPDILARLIASAVASGDPLASSPQGDTTYYLRRAEYIGTCDAPFGRVHAGEFLFVRSAPKDSTLPARGHNFVVFFDAALRVRDRWELDAPLTGLAFDHTKMVLGSEALFDFAHPPENGSVIIGGKPQKVPHWTPTK